MTDHYSDLFARTLAKELVKASWLFIQRTSEDCYELNEDALYEFLARFMGRWSA